MTWFRRLWSGRTGGAQGPGRPSPENTEADPRSEGLLEPNTAALMDGAPPAGVSGRAQPAGDPWSTGSLSGPTESDTRHLPG